MFNYGRKRILDQCVLLWKRMGQLTRKTRAGERLSIFLSKTGLERLLLSSWWRLLLNEVKRPRLINMMFQSYFLGVPRGVGESESQSPHFLQRPRSRKKINRSVWIFIRIEKITYQAYIFNFVFAWS